MTASVVSSEGSMSSRCYITVHYITVQYIILHYGTLRYVTVQYITLQYSTSVVSSEGSMSSRRSTRYVEVPRRAASRSSGLPAATKCVTSAMWIPT